MVISDTDFRQFVDGNEKSFEKIFSQYHKTLVSYSMRHELELMEAEDVVLEVFHHIWQIRKELKSPSALHTLLFTATRNRTLTVIRNLKRRQRIVDENYALPEVNEEPRDYLIEEEMSRLLDEGISKLPKQCAFVILGLFAGKTIQELAVEMQISVNTAKTYKLRAIQSLRELLKEHPFLILVLTIRWGKF